MLTARLVSISSNFRITPKIEPLVVFAIPNKLWQKHNLLGGGKNDYMQFPLSVVFIEMFG